MVKLTLWDGLLFKDRARGLSLMPFQAIRMLGRQGDSCENFSHLRWNYQAP